ncbi:MAG: hypothetical protein ACJAS1_001644 [Oleiphilaceae bacterium]|jgi:hypothetical protein
MLALNTLLIVIAYGIINHLNNNPIKVRHMTKQADYQIGDDIINNKINLMGNFRNHVDSNTIKVRTVRGLQEWAICDCTKSVSGDLFINNEGDIVELLPNTTTSKYGDVLYWVKCINGNVVSIFEAEFKSIFSKVA